MKTKTKTILTISAFSLCAGALALYAGRDHRAEPEPPRERPAMRVLVPTGAGEEGRAAAAVGRAERESPHVLKASMEPGEFVISTLNHDFENRGVEDQIVAFRGSPPAGGNGGPDVPVSIAFFSFADGASGHRRMWDLPTAATAPATVSLFSLDLLGDRSNVVVVTGMNYRNEHTMTVFRRNPFHGPYRPFDVIAEIRTDGSVSVRETQRSLAFRQGFAAGQPFSIVAAGSDPDSDNILDRIEWTYSFDPAAGVFRRAGSTRVPGARIEHDRVRHILSGAPGAFEDFIHDLWYHVTPQGAIDRSQFIFFDPARREIVFFGEESRQVFVWQNSNATRQGIFIAGHNSQLTGMRRRVNVELQSMDSIRVTVTDDRRQRIGIPPPWSGTYRRAGAMVRAMLEESQAMPPIKDAAFDGPFGRLRFFPCGEFELSALDSLSRGRYVFFRAGDMDLLELRPHPEYAGAPGAGAFVATLAGADGRQVFRVTGVERDPRGRPDAAPRQMGLSRVRLGATGIHDLHEAGIALTRAE